MPLNEPLGEPMPMQADEFKSATSRNIVSFNVKDINPPSLLYIQRDDQLTMLIVADQSPATFTLVARLMLAATKDIVTIERDLVVTTALGLASTQISLAEGYLLSVAVKAPVTVIQQGEALVEVLITRGVQGFPFNATSKPASVLICDYVTAQRPVAWPNGRLQNFGDGPGATTEILISTPGAGAETVVIVPLTVLWEVISFSLTFTTAVAAGNRSVQLQIGGGATTHYTGQPSQVIAPSTTATISGCQTGQPFNSLVTDVTLVIPPHNLLIGGDQIRTLTAGINGSDQFNGGRMRVRQWVGLS